MKVRRTQCNAAVQPETGRIRTTFFELISAFIDAAKNDAEIIVSIKQLFERSDVRLLRSLAPVRLVAGASHTTARRKRKFIKAGTSWA
jgi:hypothetical protein